VTLSRELQERDAPLSVSIVVCTYNRAQILAECLGALAGQAIPGRRFEVIVIDNSSTDATLDVATGFAREHPHFKVVPEPCPGLSHARNRGWKEAASDWVAYVDDDARVSPHYGERLVHIIESHPFDCFGGIYTPWYAYGKPRWFRDGYASNSSVQDHTGVLEKGFASGGNFAIRKALLEKFGGFSSGFGMRPEGIAYGEESLLQMQLRAAGHVIGFDPGLVVEHLVAREKLSPWWHVGSAYARSRDYTRCLGAPFTALTLLRPLRSVLHDLLSHSRRFTPRLLEGGYYRENWIIDVLGPAASHLGALKGALLSKAPGSGGMPVREKAP
jgi:glucosyl-dolichyl phosphate glucuronosyltransferase